MSLKFTVMISNKSSRVIHSHFNCKKCPYAQKNIKMKMVKLNMFIITKSIFESLYLSIAFYIL